MNHHQTKNMKNLPLMAGIAVSCLFSGFLAGLIVCYLWLRSQHPLPVTQGVDEAGTGGNRRTQGGNGNARSAKFEALDLDRDGVLSFTEFAGGRNLPEPEKWFKLRDANNDGVISREEFLPFSAAPKGQ
jgi:hypothetical protein